MCAVLGPITCLNPSRSSADTTLAWKELLVVKRMQTSEQEPEGEEVGPRTGRAESERPFAVQDWNPAKAIMFLLPRLHTGGEHFGGLSALAPRHLMCRTGGSRCQMPHRANGHRRQAAWNVGQVSELPAWVCLQRHRYRDPSLAQLSIR